MAAILAGLQPRAKLDATKTCTFSVVRRNCHTSRNQPWGVAMQSHKQSVTILAPRLCAHLLMSCSA